MARPGPKTIGGRVHPSTAPGARLCEPQKLSNFNPL